MTTRRNFFKYLGLAGGAVAGGAAAAASVLPNPESNKIKEQIANNSDGTLSIRATYGEQSREWKEAMRLDSSGTLYLGAVSPSQGLYAHNNSKYVPGTEKQVDVAMKPGPDGELYLKVNGKWRKIVTE